MLFPYIMFCSRSVHYSSLKNVTCSKKLLGPKNKETDKALRPNMNILESVCVTGTGIML